MARLVTTSQIHLRMEIDPTGAAAILGYELACGVICRVPSRVRPSKRQSKGNSKGQDKGSFKGPPFKSPIKEPLPFKLHTGSSPRKPSLQHTRQLWTPSQASLHLVRFQPLQVLPPSLPDLGPPQKRP